VVVVMVVGRYISNKWEVLQTVLLCVERASVHDFVFVVDLYDLTRFIFITYFERKKMYIIEND